MKHFLKQTNNFFNVSYLIIPAFMQILVLLRNKSDLEAYDKDSYHVKVKETFILPNLDKGADKPVMALDWEVENADIYISYFILSHHCNKSSFSFPLKTVPPTAIDDSSSKYLSIGLCAMAAIGAVVVLRSML